MITRIEIDGFKTFEDFALDIGPFMAIVGPNASGKSNLFDAIKFVAALAQKDIRSAMQDVRGTSLELFRRLDPKRRRRSMRFAIEVLLPASGEDAFGNAFDLRAQRLRYEVEIAARADDRERYQNVYVRREHCVALARGEERQPDIGNGHGIRYGGRLRPFVATAKDDDGEPVGFEIRQDGPRKRGRPVTLASAESPRTALSTITTAEFPHLYALREMLASLQFLHVDPHAGRRPADRLGPRRMLPDASNLATVLARLGEETGSPDRPDGALSDIGLDLSFLIPSVARIEVDDSPDAVEHTFRIRLADRNSFSSRVISDGTLRLVALLTVLNDPDRSGMLCLEEPENGIHEARIAALVGILRAAAGYRGGESPTCLQVLITTHSPAVLHALEDREVVACDVIGTSRPGGQRTLRTRMRTAVFDNPENGLTRAEVDAILRKPTDAV